MGGLVWTSMAFYEHYYVKAYTFYELMPLIIASLILIPGYMSLNGAIAYGKAGICQAMLQI